MRAAKGESNMSGKESKPSKAKPAAKKSATKAPAKKAAKKAASTKAPAKTASPKSGAKKPAKERPPLKPDADGIIRLTGGNPQIPKGDGDAPVQAFIAAMPPGWKQELGRYLDQLIVRTVPGITKAVRWNSPFYAVGDGGFFLGFHVMTKYIKVSFLKGSSLTPEPPVGSKDPDARYVHLSENEEIDEKQLASWIKQASKLPGWKPGA